MPRSCLLTLAVAAVVSLLPPARAADPEQPKKVPPRVAPLLEMSADDVLKRLDKNQDGFLDKDELRRAVTFYLAAQAGGRPDGPPAARPETPEFDALDLDADGRLTREELKGTPLADEFDEIDTNKDGKIDRKEFAAYFKKQAEKKAP